MSDPVWIFGYGSLIWRVDFPILDSRPGRIEGWTRRFWQGSHDHRGVTNDPGRVVTLIEAPDEQCYGRAYLIDPGVFEHLDYREKNGYRRYDVDIVFDDGDVSGMVYIGTPSNFAFLGEAPPDEIAAHILRCSGSSGSNLDYLLQLAHALRKLNYPDPHTFELERLVKNLMHEPAWTKQTDGVPVPTTQTRSR